MTGINTETEKCPTKCAQSSKDLMASRLKKRDLNQLLLSKFINEYGYEKGKVAALALVRDIIETVESYYVKSDFLRPGEIIWSAACKDERHGQGKTLNNTKRKVIRLSIFADEDIDCLGKNYSCYRDIQKKRTVRLINQAYEQKTVLTEEELSILLAVNIGNISKWIIEYQNENKKLLPIRGNIADIGPGITHKKQIIELHLKGMLTPEIARRTNHSKQAVDRYIVDFERINVLKERKFIPEEISQVTKRGKKVVQEYLKLID